MAPSSDQMSQRMNFSKNRGSNQEGHNTNKKFDLSNIEFTEFIRAGYMYRYTSDGPGYR